MNTRAKRKPAKCVQCGSAESIRTILYGMPIAPVDESVYALGGCVIEEDMPTYRCVDCGWSI